jgi:hypothetical protein
MKKRENRPFHTLMKGLALVLVCHLSACQSKGGPKVDPEIMKALEAVVAHCEVGVSGNTVGKCQNEEYKSLRAMFNKSEANPQPKDKIEALDTFSEALKSEKQELAVVASSLLYNEYRDFGPSPEPSRFTAPVAQRLIAAVGQAPKYQAAQALKAAVHAGMLSGEQEALYQMLDQHSYAAIPGLGYPYIMRYARMQAFPKVKQLAQSEDPKSVTAAFQAPGNMPKPTAEEQAEICPWAKGYLADSRDSAYLGAARLMLSCKGEYIDALLDEGEKRLAKDNRFTRDDYMVYRDVCFSPIKGLIKEAGFQAQCARTAAFLEKAVNNEKVESLPRGLALFAIYYQRRNAESMKVMQKYKNHADPNIKKYANESIQSLVKTYKVPE